MRPLLAPLGVSIMIGLAAPAYGDPGGGSDDVGFLATVRDAGITYTDSGQAIAFGKAVCGLIGAGKSGPELVSDLQTEQPRINRGSRNAVRGDFGEVLLPATTFQQSTVLGAVAAVDHPATQRFRGSGHPATGLAGIHLPFIWTWLAGQAVGGRSGL